MSHSKRTYIVFALTPKISRWCINNKEVSYQWNTYRYTRTELLKELKFGVLLNKFLDNYIEEPKRIEVCKLPQHVSYYNLHSFVLYYCVHAGKILSFEYLYRLVSNYNNQSCEMKKATKFKNSYRFRYDPVPDIGHCHWGSFYRLGHLGQVRKQNNYGREDEYSVYNSKKYAWKNLPEWDDKPRSSDRSWKTSYKCKKQWQKNTNAYVAHL